VFKGRELASTEGGAQIAYLTPKGAIAVYFDPDQGLNVYDTYDAFISDGQDDDLLLTVAEALGEEYAEELDI
jgi:hypothetical protein